MPDTLEKPRLIGSVIAEKLPPAFQIALLLSNMESRWEEVVGQRLAPHSRPESMDRTGLVVICDTPASGQLLNMGAATYLHRIKNRFGVEVSGIRTVVVTRLERRRPGVERRIRKLRISSAFVDEAMAEVAPKIKNTEVARALAMAMAAARARYGYGRRNENNPNNSLDVNK